MATKRLTATLAVSPNSGPARVAPKPSLPTALAVPTGSHARASARANAVAVLAFVEPTTASAVLDVNLFSEHANPLRRTLRLTALAAQMARHV